ncbi:chromosome segregation SMC family protein [Glacieibacterium frigidum]|uniref:Chromosome partition protein Smc n=1 Tax=Glacieibacterium frigidum TaxID=2593303 RepID=A0A552UIS6_9SPHN|nr:AAA family ATPase [Glacieibacterium frigidum]TRW18129.1 AAA family ATPase [Glacieibacterium frigidum]
MHFERLRLAGFKSFVEACELRIEPGLTGVVGPNGCGKSNLLEAIRWAMGEGSPKSLRGGAMDDVIFAGTAARPSREFAEVTLRLDNSARTAPAGFNDDDQIEVTRRIERGLGSAYRLNGRDCRARDIQMLFADNATGAHSPALVSQGRIGAIVAASPVERRALLEEAAGIAGLHVRRKEAEIRLRAAEANLVRLEDVLAGMTAQVAALRRQARAAARYTELSDAVRVAEGALLFARWRTAADSADAANAAAREAEGRVAAATRDVARLAVAQAEATAGLPALREAEARAAAALQHVTQQRSLLAADLERVAARQRDLAAQAAAAVRDRDREQALAADAEAALMRGASQAAALDEAIAAGRAQLPALAAAVADAEQASGQGEAAYSAAVERHAAAAAQARAAEAALAAAEARLARTNAEIARVESSAAAPDDGSEARRDAARAAADAATQAIDKATADLAASEDGRRLAGATRDEAQAVAATLRGQRAALQAEHDALLRVLASGKAGPSVLDALTVEPGYEAALVAALRDDLSAGLRTGARHWAGAAEDGDPALPPGARPLSDVVQGPPELARRLAQVGIVDGDPDPASLRPGQRLVARDGRMWRWDGFRTAGGAGHAAAERLVQRARLAVLAGELPGLATQLADADAAVAAAIADLGRHADAERRAREGRAAAERARAAALADAARAEAAIERRAAQVQAAAAMLARLNDDAAGHAAERDAAQAAAQAVTGLGDLAQAVGDARTTVQGARAALAAARATHDTAQRGIAGDERQRSALAADGDAWRGRAAASQTRLDELAARIVALESDAAGLAERPAEIAAETARLATSIAEAEAARRAAADALAAAEGALRDLDTHARAAADALSDAREARARATTQAEHHEARRAEYAATAADRFEAAPIHLPQRLGFETGGDPDDLARRFEGLTAERDRLGPVNLRAGIELDEIEATLAASTAERQELETAIARLRGSIGALNREGRLRLIAAFETVDAHFRTLFATLFEGGAAHLALTESDDPLAAGLEIMAQPRAKKLQSLTLLSGGEQALTAVALIFALFLTTPSPLCVLDEVDAPLDDANVERFCDLLNHMAATTRTRFLIVTHNAVTMSRMHRLYGVTMGEPGVSQLVSVDLARAEALLN